MGNWSDNRTREPSTRNVLRRSGGSAATTSAMALVGSTAANAALIAETKNLSDATVELCYAMTA